MFNKIVKNILGGRHRITTNDVMSSHRIEHEINAIFLPQEQFVSCGIFDLELLLENEGPMISFNFDETLEPDKAIEAVKAYYNDSLSLGEVIVEDTVCTIQIETDLTLKMIEKLDLETINNTSYIN
jgi:hypothetical protein